MKLDLVKTDKQYYTAKPNVELREFPTAQYITIDGQGEPAGPEFTSAVEALYPLAYGIKKLYKFENRDFGVAKLEGLWWSGGGEPLDDIPRTEWQWKLMIRMPDFVESFNVDHARKLVFESKGLEKLRDIAFETIHEGLCVQVMHKGPYSTEPATIKEMDDFIARENLEKNGPHHEIYLSDPRRTAPEKMRTILRQPVKRKA